MARQTFSGVACPNGRTFCVGRLEESQGENLHRASRKPLTIKRTQVPVAEPGPTLFDGTALAMFPYMTTSKRHRRGTASMVVPPAIAAFTQPIKQAKTQQ